MFWIDKPVEILKFKYLNYIYIHNFKCFIISALIFYNVGH